jgi:hypothetical protein
VVPIVLESHYRWYRCIEYGIGYEPLQVVPMVLESWRGWSEDDVRGLGAAGWWDGGAGESK